MKKRVELKEEFWNGIYEVILGLFSLEDIKKNPELVRGFCEEDKYYTKQLRITFDLINVFKDKTGNFKLIDVIIRPVDLERKYKIILPTEKEEEKKQKYEVELYAFRNPVYSGEEILALIKKSFPKRRIEGHYCVSACEQLICFEKQLRELGYLNAIKLVANTIDPEQILHAYRIETEERAKLTPPHPMDNCIDPQRFLNRTMSAIEACVGREYEIWMEGYAVTGDRQGAEMIGKGIGNTFDKAVIDYMSKNDNHGIEENKTSKYNSKESYHNRKSNWNIWACNLFDNEVDARKSFG